MTSSARWLAMFLVLAGCASHPEDGASRAPIIAADAAVSGDATVGAATGGVYATFETVDGARFSAWVQRHGAVRDAIRTWRRRLTMIPIGELSCTTEWNTGWSWHLEDTRFAELAIELCDGLPSHVEETHPCTDYGAGQYCPWSASMVELRDCRSSTADPPACPPMPR
jgi:hypothetical protein